MNEFWDALCINQGRIFRVKTSPKFWPETVNLFLSLVSPQCRWTGGSAPRTHSGTHTPSSQGCAHCRSPQVILLWSMRGKDGGRSQAEFDGPPWLWFQRPLSTNLATGKARGCPHCAPRIAKRMTAQSGLRFLEAMM